MKTPKNILLVRTDRIGDVVLSLPLVNIIKKHYPDCKISILIKNYTKDLTANYPGLENVIVLNQKEGNTEIFSNVSQIKKGEFDSCIVVYPTFKIALLLFLSGIKKRIGTGYRWYSFLFNKKMYEHRKYGEKHELEYNIGLLQHLGIDESVDKNSVSFNLQISPQSEQFVENTLNKLKFDENLPTIIIHPGSSGSAVDLPISKFIELSNMLAHQLKANILITGSDSEKEICNSIAVDGKMINLAGKFDLSQLMALVNRADLLIANSTGPIHIAAALGKNVIGFYPKIDACSPRRWGPYTDKKAIFSPTIGCSNCTKKQCEELDCMSTIKINEVFESVKNFLS